MNSFDQWDNELYHYGVKGQKWGLRRYQNADGSLTEEGKARYGVGGTASARETARFLNSLDRQRAHANVKAVEQLAKKGRGSSSIKVDQYKKTMDVTNRTINDVLQAASKNKMKISSKDVKRHILTGQTVAKSVTGSVAMSLLLSNMVTPESFRLGNSGYYLATKNIIAPMIFTKKAKGTKYKADYNQYRKRT